MKIKSLQILSLITAFVWTAVGIITVGSIYLSMGGFVINVVVGSLFIFIGQFIFWKERYFVKFLREAVSNNKKLKVTVIISELFFIGGILLVGLVAFFGVFSRVFLEGFAVFG